MSTPNNDTEHDKSPAPKLEGHSYDGIEELDNALPSWWINGFYLTIIFALGYFMYYFLGDGPTLVKEYQRAKNELEYAQYLHRVPVKLANESELQAMLKDSGRVESGRGLFKSKCVQCHGDQGQGGIGPNLTDHYWIHGGKMTDLLATITNGVPDKGMPPWGAMLKQEEIYSVVTFVRSIRDSNPPNAKASQGTLEKE